MEFGELGGPSLGAAMVPPADCTATPATVPRLRVLAWWHPQALQDPSGAVIKLQLPQLL